MSNHIKIAAIIATAALGATIALAGPSQPSIVTQINVEVGFPREAATPGGHVEIAPGTVLAIAQPGVTPASSERQAVIEHMLSYQKLRDRLISTFRLDYARQTGSQRFVTLKPGATASIPMPVKSDVTITVRQAGGRPGLASYRVIFRQGATILADTPVSIVPGSRAVVGAMDGPSAPYIFVVLRPLPPGEAGIISSMSKIHDVHEAGITKPKLVKSVAPTYPKSARKDKVSGAVVLQAIIGTDGTVQNVTPLRSPDERLTQAAERAVLQWKFKPARDRAGHAIPVFYFLTVRFSLQ